jgi:hypothetical protein
MNMENKINLSYSPNSYAKCYQVAQTSLSLAEREERLLKRLKRSRQQTSRPQASA